MTSLDLNILNGHPPLWANEVLIPSGDSDTSYTLSEHSSDTDFIDIGVIGDNDGWNAHGDWDPMMVDTESSEDDEYYRRVQEAVADWDFSGYWVGNTFYEDDRADRSSSKKRKRTETAAEVFQLDVDRPRKKRFIK